MVNTDEEDIDGDEDDDMNTPIRRSSKLSLLILNPLESGRQQQIIWFVQISNKLASSKLR